MWRSLFLILILFGSMAFAQTQEPPKAIKIDEFGRLGECDLGARLDNLRIELMNNSTAKGIIIVYHGIDAYPSEYNLNQLLRQIKTQMTFRSVDLSKIELIDGGFRKHISAELWIVPQGAEIPKPSETLPKPEIPTDKTFIFAKRNLVYFDFEDPIEFLSGSARKERLKLQKDIDEEDRKNGVESLSFNETSGFTNEEIEEMKFDWAISSFGEILKTQEDSTATIILYGDNKYYSIKNVLKHVEEGKQRIAKESDIPANRINVIYGGYRDMLQAEFWIIPKNGRTPKPIPEKREN